MEKGSQPTYNIMEDKVEKPLGYSWPNLTQTDETKNPFGDDTITLPTSLQVMGFLVLNCAIFTLLGMYLDQVMYYNHAAWFFVQGSTWRRWTASWPIIGPWVKRNTRRENTVDELPTDPRLAALNDELLRSIQGGSGDSTVRVDDDVANEVKKCIALFESESSGDLVDIVSGGGEDDGDHGVAVNIVKMSKVYRNNPFFRTDSDKLALKNQYLAIEKNRVFCLLGHNGAGKTTTLHVLNGLFPPSGGTATMMGLDVRYDMSELRQLVGLCPQHDILWPELTAGEHLELFAAIKGVSRKDTPLAVAHQLAEVSLSHVTNNKAGTFSGGMKRRLSVAVASIGQPKLVFMDEATTGLDPVSKRGVWQLVEELKERCTVILTTHSLEEADFLSDRIAIMADGQVRCLGSPLHLKNRYGSGYRIHLTCEQVAADEDGEESGGEDGSAEVRQFFSKNAPSMSLVSDNAGNLTFAAAADDLDTFVHICELLEDEKTRPEHVRDWGVSQTTLEDVFIRVTEEEAASQWFGATDDEDDRPLVGLDDEK
jgi:ABC-type multidrug transport system ATPase subunit